MSIQDEQKVEIEYKKKEIFGEKMMMLDEFAAAILPMCYADMKAQRALGMIPINWKEEISEEAYSIASAMLKTAKKWREKGTP